MSNTLFVFLILATAGFVSCKKDPSSTATNRAPVANAGKDTTIRLPVDSAALDGSSSYDPDGSIESYLWRQVAGPSTADILEPDRRQAKAKRLEQGIYSFELKISDNSGSFSIDTVDVRVLSLSGNIVANAGPDKVITLPVMEAPLEASASRDPSGLALSYQWRQIEGPASYIRNALAITTSVALSSISVYQFELKVWNRNGIAYDTIMLTLKANPDCPASRTEVPAQLIPVKQFPFSFAAKLLAVGNKLIIPVDLHDPIAGSWVYVHDVATGTYTVKELDFPRFGAATAVAGNKVFFAGGITDFKDEINLGVTDVVDIYDAATGIWSKAKLSQARAFVKAATVGNKVVFAGGLKSNVLSSRVDIYDVQTNQWTTSELIGGPRAIERVVTNQQRIYFLGGYTGWGEPEDGPFGGGVNTLIKPTRTIDFYNVSSGGWSTANMEVIRTGFSAISVDDKIVIAGGVAVTYPFEQLTENVEIFTVPTMQRSNSCLSSPKGYGSEAAVIKNNSILFYSGGSPEKNRFDIYNPRTGEWKVGIQNGNEPPSDAALATINNEVYVLIGNSLYKLDY